MAVGRGEICLGRAEPIFFVGGIETRDRLTGRDLVTNVDRALDDVTADSEREFNLGLTFNRAGELHGLAGLVLVNGYHADGTILALLLFP